MLAVSGREDTHPQRNRPWIINKKCRGQTKTASAEIYVARIAVFASGLLLVSCSRGMA